MDIKDRVKQVRLDNGLSQSDFARRIGFAQNSYSKIENGTNPVKDRHIISICHEFFVSETWLRTGVGDMYTDEDAAIIEDVARRYHLTDAHRAMLRTFLKLDKERRYVIIDIAYRIIEDQRAEEAAARAALIDQRTRESQSPPDADTAASDTTA